VFRLTEMKHQLDFEKPILELQQKLEELKKQPETHSLDISFEEEVGLIEKKLEETKRQIFATCGHGTGSRLRATRNGRSRWITWGWRLATSASCTVTGSMPRIGR